MRKSEIIIKKIHCGYNDFRIKNLKYETENRANSILSRE